jgi:TRC40/GET3/ArsA family transport-energizing ATPase
LEGSETLKIHSRLEKAKVIVSAGTGGVGKTTVSAALGVMLASKGQKVLVLTIDPAQRLAQALGLDSKAYESVKVSGVTGELYASMIDPKRIFDQFVERFSPSPQISEKLKSNRLYQQLVSALTGSQEFTSMDRLLSEVERETYDVIILDTPPTQNAVDFLKAPKRVVQLFDERITKWFIQSGTKVNIFTKIVSRGTQTALTALEKVTGAEFILELSDFFEQMSYLQKSVKERSEKVEDLLLDESTQFIVVANADEEKLQEAKTFSEALTENGFHMNCLILNRSYPEWFYQANISDSKSEFFRETLNYYQQQLKRVTALQAESKFGSVYALPEASRPLNGIKDIVKLSQVMGDL